MVFDCATSAYPKVPFGDCAFSQLAEIRAACGLHSPVSEPGQKSFLEEGASASRTVICKLNRGLKPLLKSFFNKLPFSEKENKQK